MKGKFSRAALVLLTAILGVCNLQSYADHIDSYEKLDRIELARKSVRSADQIVFMINDLVRRIESSGERRRNLCSGTNSRSYSCAPRYRYRLGLEENDSYALLAVKQLAPRVQRGSEAMLRAVRAADRGDYNRFYSEERTACRLWFDAKEQAIFSERRILDMDGNTGVVWRSDFRIIANSIRELIIESSC